MKRRLAVSLVLIALCACDDGPDNHAPATTTTSVTVTTSTSVTTTTSSSTSTTSTTATTTTEAQSTTTSVTSTSIIIECFPVDVVFSITNTETIGALQYDTTYPDSGTFLGAASTVECQRMVLGDFITFNEIEAEHKLITAIASLEPITGPTDIATCRYWACPTQVTVDDFVVTIVDQSRPDFTPANATVAVTRVVY